MKFNQLLGYEPNTVVNIKQRYSQHPDVLTVNFHIQPPSLHTLSEVTTYDSIFLTYMFQLVINHQVHYFYLSHCTTNANNCDVQHSIKLSNI